MCTFEAKTCLRLQIRAQMFLIEGLLKSRVWHTYCSPLPWHRSTIKRGEYDILPLKNMNMSAESIYHCAVSRLSWYDISMCSHIMRINPGKWWLLLSAFKRTGIRALNGHWIRVLHGWGNLSTQWILESEYSTDIGIRLTNGSFRNQLDTSKPFVMSLFYAV